MGRRGQIMGQIEEAMTKYNEERYNQNLYTLLITSNVGLDSIVVSIPHCGCGDPSSILGLVRVLFVELDSSF